VSTKPEYTDVQIGRLEALRSSLQRTDRVMAESRTVSLTFSYQEKKGTPAPAYLNGQDITICLGWIEDPASQEGLVHILGLNAHELAHYLYSVGVETLKKRYVSVGSVPISPKFHEAYRILEDQRIETLMSAKYRRTEKYFSYPVIAHMVNDKSTWPSAFLLTHGRRYLPKKVRTMFRDIFEDIHKTQVTDEFASIIDEFRLLSFTTVQAQQHACVLVDKFARLMEQNFLHSSGGGDDHPASSATVSSAETDEDVRLAVLLTEMQDERDQGGDQDAGRGDGEDGSDGQDQDSADGRSAGNGPDGDDQSSQKPGFGVSTSGAGGQDLKEALEDVISALIVSEEIVNDVQNLLRAMNDTGAGMTSILPALRTNTAPVTPDMVEESARMQEELRRLWASLDPGWVWDQPDGRVDMNRAAVAREPEDYEHIYTAWDEGQQENSGVHYAMLVDFSSSMGTKDDGKKSRIRSASEAVWEVKHALQEIEAKGTVLAYNDGCYSLYELDDRVERGQFDVISANGSTEPRDALREARRILNMSPMRNRLLVVVSDGEWWNNSTGSDGYPELIGGTDAVKLAILIGPVKFNYGQCFDTVIRVPDARQIFPAVGSTVTRMIERNAH
jgi:hypothetical protein